MRAFLLFLLALLLVLAVFAFDPGLMRLATRPAAPEPAAGGEPAAPPGAPPEAVPDVVVEPEPEVVAEPEPEPPPAPDPVSWPYEPGGALYPGSGSGTPDPTLWAAGMRFPIEVAPAFANSQVYGYGGGQAPGPGGQCDARNYSYPWRDNFCESRSAANGMCPAARGHQGQDIRPSTCQDATHWVVAAEDGVVTSIGSYSVFIQGASGRIYRYLHMDMPHVRSILAEGQHVTRGQRIGKVSNDFGGTPTTIHLHFEIKAPVTRDGATAIIFVPTYSSLVDSYGRLLNGAG